MLGCCVTIPKVTEMKDLLSDKATVQAITSLCQSSDVWLYQLGVQCLRRINKFIPKFNGTSQQLTMRMERPLKQWNEDDVARWAAEQRFNTYAPLFQNGWVDGDLLLALVCCKRVFQLVLKIFVLLYRTILTSRRWALPIRCIVSASCGPSKKQTRLPSPKARHA